MEYKDNLWVLLDEINWLQQVINHVISVYLQHEGASDKSWLEILPPTINASENPYKKIIEEWELNSFQRLAIALAITPHLKPEVLDVFFGKNQLYDRGFTEFGGAIDKEHSGFLPTGQTLLFLASANQPEFRFEVLNIFQEQNVLTKEQVLSLSETSSNISDYNGILSISNRWLHFLMTGETLNMEQSATFPAKRITTHLKWNDIVLNNHVMDQVQELNTWLEYGDTLMNDWELYKKIKPGYRALFYGPPGTGKTLTVTLLGKASQREVYRVDLSMIVSKYIGETEKNLAKIFDSAEHKNWILFFDEADALFGKRTESSSSNDRHANQQTSYLLQRIEDFPGVIILASNLKSNMDEAFMRRFQSIIHFTKPSAEERYQIWKKVFSGKCQLDSEIDLIKVAEQYDLAGGAIINVLRYCALMAIQRGDTIVNKQELMQGVRKELKKEGKTVTAFYN